MKRRHLAMLILAAVLIAVGLMPYGRVKMDAPFVAGGDTRPFETARQSPPPQDGKPQVSLAIVMTSTKSLPEALMVSGGSWTRMIKAAQSGFLIRHGNQTLAFDLGLGSHISQQFSAEMPFWARPAFGYAEPVVPMIRQLSAQHVAPPTAVILSHGHWDHAAGLEDFPLASVWVPQAELDHIKNAKGHSAGEPWPSQVGRPGIRWQRLTFPDGAYMGFARSLDIFRDSSVVAVPLPGHTAGAVGLFVTVGSGRRFLLVGDTLWNAAQLEGARGKFFLASRIVDADRTVLADTVAALAKLAQENPDLTIVPAHDGDLQTKIGLFPHWVS